MPEEDDYIPSPEEEAALSGGSESQHPGLPDDEEKQHIFNRLVRKFRTAGGVDTEEIRHSIDEHVRSIQQ